MPPEQDSSDGQDQARLRARAFWSGTLTFGLVSIPVDLFPATRSQRVSLRMLDEDGTPLSRRYYSPVDGREVTREHIVRGYEVDDDEYVVVTDEELEALEPRKSRDIDLRRFVPADQIDPMYFERAYFLAPAGDSTKAYRLLAEAMERTGRAGVATFVMRTREYLVAILAENGILRAETLRFADEIRSAQDVGLPTPVRAERKLVKRLEAAIEKHSADSLDIEELRDRESERLLALIERKREASEDVVEAPEGAEAEPEADVIDLMEVLRQRMRATESDSEEDSADVGEPEAELRSRTRQELYQRAQELDIPGRSRMNKEELIGAIRRSA